MSRLSATFLLAIFFSVVVLAVLICKASALCVETGLFCVDSCNYVFCDGINEIGGLQAVTPGTKCTQVDNSIILEHDFWSACELSYVADRFESISKISSLNYDSVDASSSKGLQRYGAMRQLMNPSQESNTKNKVLSSNLPWLMPSNQFSGQQSNNRSSSSSNNNNQQQPSPQV